MEVPAEAEPLADLPLRSPLTVGDHRVLLLGIEVRRVDHPAVDRLPVGGRDLTLFDARRLEIGVDRVVEAGELHRLAIGDAEPVDLPGPDHVLPRDQEAAAVGSHVAQTPVVAALAHLAQRAIGDAELEDLVGAAMLGHEEHRSGIGRPGQLVGGLVQLSADLDPLPRGAIEEHDAVAIGLETGTRHAEEGEPAAIGRVAGIAVPSLEIGAHTAHDRRFGREIDHVDVGVGGARRVVGDLGGEGDLTAIRRPGDLLPPPEGLHRAIGPETLHQVHRRSGGAVLAEGSDVKMTVGEVVPRIPMAVHEAIDDPRVGLGQVGVEVLHRRVELHVVGEGDPSPVGRDHEVGHPALDLRHPLRAIRALGPHLRRRIALAPGHEEDGGLAFPKHPLGVGLADRFGGQAPGAPALQGNDPQVAVPGIGGEVVAADREQHRLAVGGDLPAPHPKELPQQLRSHRLLLGEGREAEQAQRDPGRSSHVAGLQRLVGKRDPMPSPRAAPSRSRPCCGARGVVPRESVVARGAEPTARSVPALGWPTPAATTGSKGPG